MRLYCDHKLRGYAKDLYHEHYPADGDGKFRACYHYDVEEPGRVLEALRLGAKPVDVTQMGLGCVRL